MSVGLERWGYPRSESASFVCAYSPNGYEMCTLDEDHAGEHAEFEEFGEPA
jgi:hypothetical protein